MAKQKFRPIKGCSNYVVGSHGIIKRLKHKSRGSRHKILPEKIIQPQLNRQGILYVNLIGDNGKQKVFSVQKLVSETFLDPGQIYYKTAPDWEIVNNEQKFNNRVDQFIPSNLYDRLTYKPVIYKTIKT